jgi:hypothetical protein
MVGAGNAAPGSPPGGPGGVLTYCAIDALADMAAASKHVIAIVLIGNMVASP